MCLTSVLAVLSVTGCSPLFLIAAAASAPQCQQRSGRITRSSKCFIDAVSLDQYVASAPHDKSFFVSA
jgi:hypothetical protein